MAALATTTDLAARNGPLTPEQLARAAALLIDASEEVRAFAGQHISRVVDDEVILTADGAVIRLPQRPVEAVTAVALVDGATDIPVTGWAWTGRDEIDLTAATSTWPASGTANYRVTYTHGHATVPDLIIGTVCAMVNRTLSAPSRVDGMVAETVGQYSYQLQQGTGSQGTAPALTAREERKLARAGYRRTTSTITVRPR